MAGRLAVQVGRAERTVYRVSAADDRDPFAVLYHRDRLIAFAPAEHSREMWQRRSILD
jgi:hypothetical protein